MSMKRFDPAEADLGVLAGRTVGVLGYGNQGHAHALNLRDSGVHVVVGQRPGGRGAERARREGFELHSIGEVVALADVLILALPDESASAVYREEIAPSLRAGQTLGFVHGFNIRYGFIDPPADVDCVMVAPKGPGVLLRSLYVQGLGLPALLAIARDATGLALRTALAWAAGIGATRAAVVETTFADETEADLFGEQAVLCGGVTALTRAAFEVLVEAGYPPELAYLECVHELKQIVDLIYEGGITAMRERISNTAEYGDLTRGPRVIDESVRARLREILAEVRSGAFAREWMAEHDGGMAQFRAWHERDARSGMEAAGRAVRRMMPWLGG